MIIVYKEKFDNGFTCECGNYSGRFHPYNEKEGLVEPLPEWVGVYKCGQCDQIYEVVEDSPATDQYLLEKVIAMDENIAKADERLKELSSDKEFLKKYEKREKEIRDEISRMNGAKRQGIEEGKKEVVEKMRNKGIDDAVINEMTGIDASLY